MLNDYQRALQCQRQYDGAIPLRVVSGIVYSRITNPGQITLIFRGTSDLYDARRDLEALMIDCPFGRVHAGAYIGIDTVLDTENLPNDNTVIECIGHSLGAMRAQLAYRELYRRGYRNIKCISFECPRFGNHDAVNYAGDLKADNTYQNYLNLFEHDMFTMIPVWLIGEPYADVANCTRFWSAPTPKNEYKIKYNAPENIQAHSLADCIIPALRRLFP